MIEATINVPFSVKLDTDSHGYAYVDHPMLSASVYGSVSAAKKELKTRITEQIEEGLKTLKSYQTRAIGTKEGSVFIVRYHVGSWSYSIVGPGRKFGGSCMLRDNTFDATLAAAMQHIEQSFDGVAWECSL
jgi:hypothetical protein